MKIVLTGGPCTGKTTVIEELASRGYAILPEAARLVIAQLKKENKFSPEKAAEIQQHILSKQVELESKLDEGLVFFDRSGLDTAAYCRFFKTHLPYSIQMYAAHSGFSKVFILEPVGEFQNDEIRYENREEAKQIHELIRNTYAEFGYQPISVPVIPPKQRADFILNKLGVLEAYGN
jgi:predicted ATPase